MTTRTGDRTTGRLFVLSGPSGVGKSTVIGVLRAELPELWFSVSATTRAPRPGDVDGETYSFVTREQFIEQVRRGEMLEWAEFAGNLYGTPARSVDERLAAGVDVLLEIEVQGARQVKAARGDDATLIFLAPPSFAELAERLTSRGTETAEVQHRRLAAAREELAAEGEFDETVVNHDVHSAVAALVALIADPPNRRDMATCPD